MFKTEINLSFNENNNCILVDQYIHSRLLFFTPTYINHIDNMKSLSSIGVWKIKQQNQHS